MRVFASSVWELGREFQRVLEARGEQERRRRRRRRRAGAALGEPQGLDGGDDGSEEEGERGEEDLAAAAANAGAAAKQRWLETRSGIMPLLASGAGAGAGHADPQANIITSKPGAGSEGATGAVSLDFTPMDGIISRIVQHIQDEGTFIARVFPPEQEVLLEWGRGMADEMVSAALAWASAHACAHTREPSRYTDC